MLGLQTAKIAAKKATKPTLYLSTAAALLWFAVDLADGASDRFHQRVDQAKSTVVEPAESVMATVTEHASKLWASIESNPGPSILALALFSFTVIYHKMKGRSTLAALKAAALKEPPLDPKPPENPLVVKMQRQAIENQMLETYEKLERRQKDLPDEIKAASDGVKRAALNRQKAEEAAARATNEHNKALAYRDRLQKEFDDGLATLVELEQELNKA
jgi:Skp family chaperone for outer membrane proteins